MYKSQITRDEPMHRMYVIAVIFFGGLGGWLASWLNLAFAASLLLLNTQLIYVIRYATRNAAVCAWETTLCVPSDGGCGQNVSKSRHHCCLILR